MYGLFQTGELKEAVNQIFSCLNFIRTGGRGSNNKKAEHVLESFGFLDKN